MGNFRWHSMPDWISVATRRDDTLVIELGYSAGEVGYEHMDYLSNLFGTRNINAGSEHRSSGGCETCAWSEDVMILTVRDIKNWPGASQELTWENER